MSVRINLYKLVKNSEYIAENFRKAGKYNVNCSKIFAKINDFEEIFTSF